MDRNEEIENYYSSTSEYEYACHDEDYEDYEADELAIRGEDWIWQ